MFLLHRCLTKATTTEGDDLRYSFNWVIARRGIFKIYDDHIELGRWHLPHSDFDEAILFKYSSNFYP